MLVNPQEAITRGSQNAYRKGLQDNFLIRADAKTTSLTTLQMHESCVVH